MSQRGNVRRLLSCLAGAVVIVAATPGVSGAYWIATDSTHSARATAAVLPAGVQPKAPASSGRTVTVPFSRALTSAEAGSVVLTSYRINRYDANAGPAAKPVATLTCNTSNGPTAECLDHDVPDGTWKYTDTPLLANWAGLESSRSAGVTVDGTGPVTTISKPGNGSFGHNVTPTISGTAGTRSGDLPLITVRIYAGPSSNGPILQTKTVTAVRGSWTVAASKLAGNATYTITASQDDSAGNTGRSSGTFVLDTTAPLITLNSPGSTLSKMPRLSGSAGNVVASSTSSADSATVCVLIFAGRSTSGSPVQTLVASRTATSWAVTSPGLPAGTYTAQASQSDVAGNVSYSSSSTFTVDASAPVIAIKTPANGSATADVSPTITGTAGIASGDLNSISVQVYADSTTSGKPLQRFLRSASLGGWSVTLAALPPNRQYTVQASQQDSFGNIGLATSTFVIDTVAPLVSLTCPAPGSVSSATPTFSGSAGTVAASATASADSGTVTVRVYPAGSSEPIQTLTADVRHGRYSVTANALSSGSYTAQASQNDAAGNVSLSSSSTFTVDGTPPAVSLAAISDYLNDPTPHFSGNAGTASGDLAPVTVRIYRGATATGTPLQVIAATRAGKGWSAVAATLPTAAQYTVQASQLDAAGNVGLTTARTFTIDTSGPANLTITSPQTAETGVGSQPTITGTAGIAIESPTTSADEKTVTVRIYQGTTPDGSPVQTLVPAVGAGGVWSVRVNGRLLCGQSYTVVVSQLDELGNSSTSLPVTFQVNPA